MRLAALAHRLAVIWGGVPVPPPAVVVHAESLEQLAEVLRLADGCPAGTTGDELRRAACELIEATSSQRDGRRRHILTLIARAEWRHGHGHQRDNEPSLAALHALSVAVLAPA